MVARKPLSPTRAVRIIVTVTLCVTVAGGFAIWLLDHREFSDIGTSLWWALQTVTTVGYGDVVPSQTGGRIIGAALMLQGVGFITVVAAAVTAALIEQGRQRQQSAPDSVSHQLEQIDARLATLERALADRRDS
jgi:voltage-gated potassium channel